MGKTVKNLNGNRKWAGCTGVLRVAQIMFSALDGPRRRYSSPFSVKARGGGRNWATWLVHGDTHRAWRGRCFEAPGETSFPRLCFLCRAGYGVLRAEHCIKSRMPKYHRRAQMARFSLSRGLETRAVYYLRYKHELDSSSPIMHRRAEETLPAAAITVSPRVFSL